MVSLCGSCSCPLFAGRSWESTASAAEVPDEHGSKQDMSKGKARAGRAGLRLRGVAFARRSSESTASAGEAPASSFSSLVRKSLRSNEVPVGRVERSPAAEGVHSIGTGELGSLAETAKEPSDELFEPSDS